MKNAHPNPSFRSSIKGIISLQTLGLALLPVIAFMLIFCGGSTRAIAQDHFLTLDYTEKDAALSDEDRLKLIKKMKKEARKSEGTSPW